MNTKTRFVWPRLLNFQSLVNVHTFLFFLLFATSLNAQQWQRVGELPAGLTTALLVQGDTLYAAGMSRLYYTYDGGDTWDSTSVISPTLDYTAAIQLAQGRLYVGTEFEGVFCSTDGGQTWQADNIGLVGLGATHISSLAVRGDSLYAGTYGAKVFVKKISANSNWSPYSVGMPWFNVESLTNIDGRLFAGSGGNATVSQQAYPGHNWVEVPFAEFNGELNSFLGVVRQGDVLLGAGSQGLFRSTDQGANWTHYNPGTGILGSARFAVSGNRVYANLAKPVGLSFIKYTDDQGLSWQNFEPALTGPYGFSIAVCKGRLYSARDNGLWRIASTTGTGEPAGQGPLLGQNFPNPFSGNTIIPLTLHRSNSVELEVLSAAGSCVRTVWHGEMPAGLQHLEFDAHDLPPGIYVYRLTTDSGIVSRLMTITR